MAGQFNLHMKNLVRDGSRAGHALRPLGVLAFHEARALTQREIAATHRFVFWVSACFFTGLLFGYFVIVPLSVSFFINYEASASIVNMIDVNQYLRPSSSHRWPRRWCSSCRCWSTFPDPYGLVSSSFLKRYRRHAFRRPLVIAAIITPPDIFSLILVIIPLYWLYELSIRLSSRIERRDADGGAVAAAVISATSDEN